MITELKLVSPSGTGKELLPQHRRLIEASTISAEVAMERGYRSITKRADLSRLGFGDKQCRVPALLLPVFGVNGEIVLYQARPDDPRINDRGKAVKYETPRGARMVLDVPPRVRLLLANPQVPLFITEGIRKADAGASNRLCCIAVLGVWNWRGTNEVGGKTALPDWESIALNGRLTFLVFDSDVTTKSEVREAMRRFKDFLESRGAQVKIIYLPPGEDGGKVGLDDYLAAGHCVDELLHLAEESLREPKNDYLRACSYEANSAGITWHKETKDGPVPVQLSNFSATIVSDIERDDGVEVTRALEIEGRLAGRVFRFTVPAVRFGGMNWPIEHMGAEAVIYPGQTLKDHARAAVQLLSGSVAKRTIYVHTGWRRINEAWVYLHGGGAIGSEGLVAGVEVELPAALAPFRFEEPPTGEELQRAVAASLALIHVAPDKVIIPIIAAVWRSVLGGGDLSLHLSGPTGGGKTELAALGQQHFGPGFKRTRLPGSWSSTGNSLETLAFIAKDALFVADDFCPTGSSSDVQRSHREADRLFRAQGNNSGRGRLTSDGTLRPARPPRGLILSTGEDVPRGQSLRSRVFVIEVGPRDVDFDALTIAQAAGAKGLYSAAMAGFLKWLAPRYEELQQVMRDELAEIRADAHREGQHRRTPGIVADLHFGFRTYLGFAEEVGAITPSERDELLRREWLALGELAGEQADHQAAAEPTRRFLELLGSALSSGEAHVAAPNGGAPDSAGAWGWRERTIGTAENARTEWHPQGPRLGWIDGNNLYLDRDAAYRACQAAAGAGGEGIAVSARTLVKRLDESHLLASTEDRRESLLVRHVLEGKRRSVVHVAAESVYPSNDLPNLPTAAQHPFDVEFVMGKPVPESPELAHGLAHEPARDSPSMGRSGGGWAGDPPASAHDNSFIGAESERDGQVGQVDIWEEASLFEKGKAGLL